jgi:hypothetical protein
MPINVKKLAAAYKKQRQDLQQLADYAGELEARPTVEDHESLKGQLRGDRWQRAYRKVAKAAGVKASAMADLYKLAGITPDADEPDAQAIKKAVRSALKSRDFMLEAKAGDDDAGGLQAEPEAKASKATARREKLPAGEGAGKGTSTANPSKFKVRERDLADASYCLKHGAAIAAATAGGTLEIV